MKWRPRKKSISSNRFRQWPIINYSRRRLLYKASILSPSWALMWLGLAGIRIMWFIRVTTSSTSSLLDQGRVSLTFWRTGQWLRWSADTAILTFSAKLFAVNTQGFSSQCFHQKKLSWHSSRKTQTHFSIASWELSTFWLNLLRTRNWVVKKIQHWITF